MKKQKQGPKLVDVREALSGKQVNAQQSLVIKGGTYPWIDAPTP